MALVRYQCSGFASLAPLALYWVHTFFTRLEVLKVVLGQVCVTVTA